MYIFLSKGMLQGTSRNKQLKNKQKKKSKGEVFHPPNPALCANGMLAALVHPLHATYVDGGLCTYFMHNNDTFHFHDFLLRQTARKLQGIFAPSEMQPHLPTILHGLGQPQNPEHP